MDLPILTRVMRDPAAAAALDAPGWDVLVRQARHANLLGRLHRHLQQAAVIVPARADPHLRSAATLAERQHLSVTYEVGLLQRALEPLGQTLILLKGAAYVAAGLPSAAGRVFADVDVLVPHAMLDAAESLLMQQGWAGANLDDYDQRYYRRWMHELPPLQHIFRGTALDVHHTILPPTSQHSHIDAAALIHDSVPLPGWPGVHVLAPVDMVLHSATHLFHEGEPDNLLRDLSDLDLLLRHFSGGVPDFWPQLLARAEQHGVQLPLRLALRYCHQQLATPIPDATLHAVGAEASSAWHEQLLDFIYGRTLRPTHSSASDKWTVWCNRALYVRSHWLRMPLPLLVYHLLHKALRPPRTETIADNR
ncbi:nucleotidyltransferase domain-containing protein [Roseateles sp. P5_E7]